MPLECDVLLAEAQLLAGCDTDLFLDDVHAGDRLGDRMFHLDAGIHLDEIELAVLVEEFEGAGTTVVDTTAGIGTAVADARNIARGDVRRRRLLDHLLVAALHRAVTFAEVDRVAEAVGEHLDLHMARIFQEFFHVHHRVAEGGLGLGARHVDRVDQCRLGMHDAHAATTTTTGCLDDHRIADTLGDADDLLGVLRQRTFGARDAGDARGLHGILGRHLVAHQADRLGARADENEAGFLDTFGKVGVFREEPIARVDGLCIRHFGGRNDRRHVQVAMCRSCRADADGFVGELHILGLAVGLRVNNHRLDAQFAAGALDAESNLAPIGDENLVEHDGA